jgi:hypothetical protein
LCFIFPVFDLDLELQQEELIDLIASSVRSPLQWWQRLGTAAVMGAERLRIARFEQSPLLVVETPERCFLSSGNAVCCLDGDFMRLLDVAAIVPDDSIADEIERQHSAPPPHRPKIFVRGRQ